MQSDWEGHLHLDGVEPFTIQSSSEHPNAVWKKMPIPAVLLKPCTGLDQLNTRISRRGSSIHQCSNVSPDADRDFCTNLSDAHNGNELPPKNRLPRVT